MKKLILLPLLRLSRLLPLLLLAASCSHQEIIKTAPQRTAKNGKNAGKASTQPQTAEAAKTVNSSATSEDLKLDSPTDSATTGTVAKTEVVATNTTTTVVETTPIATVPLSAQPAPQEKFEFAPADKKEDNEEKKFSDQRFPVNSKKIGVILPITGRNSNLSASLLDSIRMGLGISPTEPGPFSLAIFDSQGTAEIAATGVEKLLRDENVVAILGGLSSREAQSISDQAEFFRVPFITFSQKSGLTDKTQYTFRNAITSEMQIKRLVEYAFTVLGARRYGVLYPNDPYGVEFANHFWDHVLARGGTITAAQVYDPKETDLSAPIQKLVGTFHIDARKEEFLERKKELAGKQKRRQENQAEKIKKSFRENEAKENILLPSVNFDVLFLPDSSRALGQVIAFMKSADVTDLTLLGTNLWNSPELSRRVGVTQSKILFVDAFHSPETTAESAFHVKYLNDKQTPPTLMDAQTYEVASILKDVLSSSSMGRDALAERLASLGRRPGAYSEVVMTTEHELERPLSIMTLDHTQNSVPIKKID